MENFNLKSLPAQLTSLVTKLRRYKVLIFLLFVVGVYGFTVWRITSLTNVQPSADAVAAQNNPIRAARIDPSVVKQLNSLRDNSVNVQTLFEQARNNPFQE